MTEPFTSASSASPPGTASTQSHLAWLRTRLSVERTFMSWTRTAVSLIGFGFTIYQFLAKLSLSDVRPGAARNFGLAFIATGILTMAIGLWQRNQEIRYLNGSEFDGIGARPGLPKFTWSNVVGLVVIVIGIVTIGWIVLSS